MKRKKEILDQNKDQEDSKAKSIVESMQKKLNYVDDDLDMNIMMARDVTKKKIKNKEPEPEWKTKKNSILPLNASMKKKSTKLIDRVEKGMKKKISDTRKEEFKSKTDVSEDKKGSQDMNETTDAMNETQDELNLKAADQSIDPEAQKAEGGDVQPLGGGRLGGGG